MATLARSPIPTQDLAHIFENIQEVTKVFAIREGATVTVWTVVDNFERAIRDRIYDIEREMFAHHSNVKFDFHVIPDCDGVDIADAELVYVR